MTSHEDLPDERFGSTPADSPDDLDGDLADERNGLTEKAQDLVEALKSRQVIIAAVAAGVVTAAAIGAKLAYDRRKSAKGYRRAVRQLEDAKDALIAATSDLPERGRDVVRRITHR